MKKTTKQLIVLMLILGVGCILEGCGKESNHSVTITLIHAWGGTEEDHVMKNFRKKTRILIYR